MRGVDRGVGVNRRRPHTAHRGGKGVGIVIYIYTEYHIAQKETTRNARVPLIEVVGTTMGHNPATLVQSKYIVASKHDIWTVL